MATVTERLAFLVSANADQAIRAFEKTANSAEKELGKATKSIDALGTNLTKFGARGLAASGAMIMLGTRFAKAGEEAVASERKLMAVTKTMGLFGDQTDTVTKRLLNMADATARNIGVDDAVIQATMTKLMTFKQLAKTADTVGGAFDRATMAAIDLAAAGFGEATSNATQLGKALQDPIKGLTALGRAGVTFTADEKAKIKTLVESGKMLQAQETLLAAVETQVKGVAAASATTSQKVSVAFNEMKESIGKGLLPIFDTIGSGLTGVSGKIESLNTATGGTVSKFAAFGAIGLGLVSTMSLVAGQAIKMRGRFVDADGSMTKMGKTASATSFLLGSLAIAETVGIAIQQLGGYARKTEQRLNDLLVVAGTSKDTKATTTAFAELADQLKNADASITGFFKTFGKAIRVAGADTDAGRIAIEYLDQAFSQIAGKSPALGQKLVDALRAQSVGLDKNGATYKDNMMLIARYQEQLVGVTGATKALSDASELAAEKAAKADAAAAAAKEKAAAAAERYAATLVALRKEIKDNFKSAVDAANGALDQATAKFNSYSEAVATAVGTNYSFADAMEAVNASTEKGISTSFLDQLTAQAGAAVEFGAKIDKLLALGISPESLQQVLAAGAQAGSLIADQLIAGGQEAVDRTDALTKAVQDAGVRAGQAAATTFYDEGVRTAISLTQGIDSVLKKYKMKLKSKGLTGKQLKKLQENFAVDVGFEFVTREMAIPELAEGGIVPATSGGRIVRVAEAGEAEAIIPLSRINNSNSNSTNNINITVNAGIAATPDQIGQQIIEAILKAQRRSGQVFASA